MMVDPNGFLSLSQGHLNTLNQCDRRFQHLFLDGLVVPTSPEQQASLDWGNRFHLLMQQRELDLPIEVMMAQDDELKASLDKLLETAPELVPTTAASGELRQSEHRRTLAFNGYLLTAIYDLICLSPSRGEIFDWKTYPTPRKRAYLAQDWQTRLYLFLLAETTDLPPENLSITYWFVRSRDAQTHKLLPQPERFNYDSLRHEQTRQDLYQVTDRLTQQLETLKKTGTLLPKVDEAKGYCETCPFAVRCQRAGHVSGMARLNLPEFASVEEVSL
ncbi:MAG: PD-(D/E)XK nuclease family protein [Cyanobacteria bacterium J06635_15]